MKPDTVRKLDYYIGIPLCFMLTVYTRIKRIFLRTRSRDRATSKVLFIKLVEQGATVLAYSAIMRASEAVGRSNVFFCVFKENRPILDILNIIPQENIFEIRQENPAIFTYDLLKFVRKARKSGIDTAIDLEFFSRASAIICYLTGAGRRIGYHRCKSGGPYRGDLMTHRVRFNPHLHVSSAYVLLVETAFRSPQEMKAGKMDESLFKISHPRFTHTETRKKRIEEVIRTEGAPAQGRPFIIFHPNSGDLLPLRRWGSEQYVQLGKRLLESYGQLSIIITGTVSERQAAEEIRKRLDSERVINLAGRTSLEDLLTLYSISDVLVTNDSGPGHFATLTDIHTIVFFGPETPELFGPLGKHVHILYEKMPCSPCVTVFNYRQSPCKDNICLQSITVERVFEEIKKISRYP